MTNGGGRTEKDRVEGLSSVLNTNISERQLLQSHTPFRDLASKYNRVLVVGGDKDNCRHVAHSYGFKDVVIPADIVSIVPSVWPFHRYHKSDLEAWANSKVCLDKKFDGILVFSDPRDLGSDTQIVIDLLVSEQGRWGSRAADLKCLAEPSVPIHFSNNDLLWAGTYKYPRFGQGAFRMNIETLYEALTDQKLTPYLIGKPFRSSYQYAEKLLLDWSKNPQKFSKVYMVGDNPLADIEGANNFGWESILVKTGVYQGSGDDLAGSVRPKFFFDDVLQAVESVTKA